jgi:O-antigen ligase
MTKQEFSEKYKSVVKTINFYTAGLLLFALPLSRYYVPLVINFWILTWILEGDFKEKFRFQNLRKNKLIFSVSALFYAVTVIGYFYSENKSEAYSYIETRLPILLFPVFLSTANHWYREKFKFLLWSFVLGNLFAAVVCLGNAFYESITFESGHLVFNTILKTHYPINFQQSVMLGVNRFFSDVLSIFLHSSYFTMFINFLILILIRFYNENLYKNRVLIGLIMFFFFIIFLLSSKIGFFIAIIVFVYFIYSLFKGKSTVFKFSVISIFVLFIGIVVFNFGYRLKGVEKVFEAGQEDNTNAEAAMDRVIVWKSTLQIIKENPVFGVGTGDIKDALEKEYIRRKFERGIEEKYNSHNQYLEMWAADGLPGILSLLFLLGVPLYFALKKKNMLFVFFMLFFMINLSVESMLNRMAAVVFFAFFYNFLIFIDPKMIDFQFKTD